MALKYEELMATSVVDLPHSYSDRDVMLYALSVGMGRDPLNTDELPYVFEQGAPLAGVRRGHRDLGEVVRAGTGPEHATLAAEGGVRRAAVEPAR